MIDHVSLPVRDLAASSHFYAQCLEPLGYRLLVERAGMSGFGTKYPELWLNARPGMAPVPGDSGAHVCLRTRTTAAVDAFHARALALGGSDGGAPGMRKASTVDYYAAFIRDLDGNRVEVMTVPQVVSAG
jgi:catechol 2,3-dioxygenase-like lactoylglutathione lyase family enzyme